MPEASGEHLVARAIYTTLPAGTVDAGVEVDVVSIDDDFERVYVQDTVDTRTAARRFVRVRVTADE